MPAPAPAPSKPTAAAPPPTITAALTPNQIIVARGYWEGPPDGMNVANPLAEVAYRRSEAPDDPDSTGSIGPSPGGTGDRPDLALAYADQPGGDGDAASGSAPMGIAALRAAAHAAREAVPPATTIAVKRAAIRPPPRSCRRAPRR